MLIWLNKFLYLPPPGALLVNAIYFVVVFLLVSLGHLTKPLGDLLSPLSWTDASVEKTLYILFLVSAATVALIYGRTKMFFICSRQCLRAALGTTLVVLVVYAAGWCIIQVFRKTQSFVVFHPHFWSFQGTLNNLKYGGILFLFASAVSFAGNAMISPDPGYKFTSFLDQWKRWKIPVEKLGKNSRLERSEHEGLENATEKMLTEVKARSGFVQPVSAMSFDKLEGPLKRFQTWYRDKTEFSYAACDRLEPVIQKDVDAIRRLC